MAHHTKETPDFLASNAMKMEPYPPYSPDLALSYFFLFGHVNMVRRDSVSADPGELVAEVGCSLDFLDRLNLIEVFRDWTEGRRRWLEMDGV
jgi:hypothetical protein